MAFEEWTRNPDGTVELFPLVAYEVLVPHGVLCGLKVHYLEGPGQMIGGESSSVPLVMTPDMARRLAGALLRTAAEAENGPAQETPH